MLLLYWVKPVDHSKTAVAFNNGLSTRIVDQFKDRKVFVANNQDSSCLTHASVGGETLISSSWFETNLQI
jgi:hypothetical protein